MPYPSSVDIGAGTVPGITITSNDGAHNVQITHDGTNGIVTTDTGDIQLQSNSGYVTHSGAITSQESASAPALASSGTITTAGIGSARVAPTANVTAVVMGTGTKAGQEVVVINQSAFSITMAASGTSHVANGTSAVIAANRCMFAKWDSVTSLWYHA